MRPMKPRETGGPHETLALMVDQSGGVKAVADFEGITASTIYKLLDPDQDNVEFSFARVARVVAHYKADAPAHLLAQLAGGTYLPVPSDGDARFTELTGAALEHIGQVSREIIDAHSPKSDGGMNFTAREARHLLAPLGSLLSDVSNLISLARTIAEQEQD